MKKLISRVLIALNIININVYSLAMDPIIDSNYDDTDFGWESTDSKNRLIKGMTNNWLGHSICPKKNENSLTRLSVMTEKELDNFIEDFFDEMVENFIKHLRKSNILATKSEKMSKQTFPLRTREQDDIFSQEDGELDGKLIEHGSKRSSKYLKKVLKVETLLHWLMQIYPGCSGPNEIFCRHLAASCYLICLSKRKIAGVGFLNDGKPKWSTGNHMVALIPFVKDGGNLEYVIVDPTQLQIKLEKLASNPKKMESRILRSIKSKSFVFSNMPEKLEEDLSDFVLYSDGMKYNTLESGKLEPPDFFVMRHVKGKNMLYGYGIDYLCYTPKAYKKMIGNDYKYMNIAIEPTDLLDWNGKLKDKNNQFAPYTEKTFLERVKQLRSLSKTNDNF